MVDRLGRRPQGLQRPRNRSRRSGTAYHTAVRRLHLASASLREVAQALAISHQRVQQIVGEAGGTWWQRAWRSRGAAGNLFCSGCGRPQSEVERLIAGPDVFICDVCVGVAERAISGHGQVGQPGVSGPRCSFCGCRQRQARLSAPEGRSGSATSVSRPVATSSTPARPRTGASERGWGRPETNKDLERSEGLRTAPGPCLDLVLRFASRLVCLASRRLRLGRAGRRCRRSGLLLLPQVERAFP